MKLNISDNMRVSIVRLYLKELERICKQQYNGDWDQMPKNASGLPINWKMITRKCGLESVQSTARVVRWAIRNDELMNYV